MRGGCRVVARAVARGTPPPCHNHIYTYYTTRLEAGSCAARGLIEAGEQGMEGATGLDTATGSGCPHKWRVGCMACGSPDALGHTIVLLSSLHMWKRIHA